MRQRLDQALVSLGLVPSRQAAQRCIMAGEVKVNGHPVTKAASPVPPDAEIEMAAKLPYVGRGGLKLAGALDHFGIAPAGWVCADLGASTGGFTDCLLQRGATKVYAIDVGHNQLAWKIRSDPRVLVMEGVNARHLQELPEPVDFCVMDLSFISLRLVLPSAFKLLRENGSVLALVKPQFELERGAVGKGGVVRDADLQQKALDGVRIFAEKALDKRCLGTTESPITGADGNREFFIWLS